MNDLIKEFCAMCRMVLEPEEIAWIEEEAKSSASFTGNPAWAEYAEWAGSEEALGTLLSYSHHMAWGALEEDGYGAGLVRPYWDRIVAVMPGLSLEWPTYEWLNGRASRTSP